MDRCMLGNSTGLRSEACCEHCTQTDIHTVCPSHERMTLTLQLRLLDKNKTILEKCSGHSALTLPCYHITSFHATKGFAYRTLDKKKSMLVQSCNILENITMSSKSFDASFAV